MPQVYDTGYKPKTKPKKKKSAEVVSRTPRRDPVGYNNRDEPGDLPPDIGQHEPSPWADEFDFDTLDIPVPDLSTSIESLLDMLSKPMQVGRLYNPGQEPEIIPEDELPKPAYDPAIRDFLEKNRQSDPRWGQPAPGTNPDLIPPGAQTPPGQSPAEESLVDLLRRRGVPIDDWGRGMNASPFLDPGEMRPFGTPEDMAGYFPRDKEYLPDPVEETQWHDWSRQHTPVPGSPELNANALPGDRWMDQMRDWMPGVRDAMWERPWDGNKPLGPANPLPDPGSNLRDFGPDDTPIFPEDMNFGGSLMDVARSPGFIAGTAGTAGLLALLSQAPAELVNLFMGPMPGNLLQGPWSSPRIPA